MKLRWTRKDKIEYYNNLAKMGLPPVDPFTKIRVNKEETVIEEEIVTQDNIREGLGVSFVMGHMGLVSVTFLKDDVQICPAIGKGIVGDDQIIQIQECIKISKGEKIKVKIKNNDEFDHVVGVRVDVK